MFMFEDNVESQGPIDSREGEARKMEPVVSSILSVTRHGLCTFRKASESADQGILPSKSTLAQHDITSILYGSSIRKSISRVYVLSTGDQSKGHGFGGP